MTFLVRDWQNPIEHEYGESIEYLDKVLQCKSDNEELAIVRQHLKQTYETLQCFLLPYPGKKVAICKKNVNFGGALAGRILF